MHSYKITKEKILDFIAIFGTCIIIAAWITLPTLSKLSKYQNLLEFLSIIPGAIYLVIKKVLTKKRVIINSKFDILLHTFFITTFLPLIFNTYFSLNSTISWLLKYSCCIVLYNVVKNLSYNKENIETIINVILAAIFAIFLYGIESQTTGKIGNFLDIPLEDVSRHEYIAFSFLYSYHNTLAVVMLAGVILSQYKIINTNNVIKRSIWNVSLITSLVGFLLAYSRICILIIIVSEIVFIIYSIRQGWLKSNNILYFLFDISAAFLFRKILLNFFSDYSEYIWIIVFANIFICYFITLMITKIKIVKFNIDKNKLMLLFIMCVVLFVIYIILSLNIQKEINVNINTVNFESQDKAKYTDIYTLSRLKKGNTYDIKLDYTISSVPNQLPISNSGFHIYFFGVNDTGEYEQIGFIPIYSNDVSAQATIHYEDKYNEVKMKIVYCNVSGSQLTIHNMYINGEKYIFDYKYIPNFIEHYIRTFNFKNVSANERLNIYKDSLKYSVRSLFIGKGGDTWKNTFEGNQSYNYYTTEVHSRFIEVLLNFGIISMLPYIAAIVIFLKRMKNTDKKYILLYLLVICIYVHAMFDWTMSTRSVLTIIYAILGFIGSLFVEDKIKYENKLNIAEIIVVIIIIIVAIYLTYSYIMAEVNYYNDDTKELAYSYKYRQYNMQYIKSARYKYQNSQDIDKATDLMEYEIKYERGTGLAYSIIEYLDVCNIYNKEADISCVKNAVNRVYLGDLYNLTYIKNYIQDLYDIKIYLKGYPNTDKYVDKCNNEIINTYEKLVKIVQNYDIYPLRFDEITDVTKESEEDMYVIVDELKRYYEGACQD